MMKSRVDKHIAAAANVLC